MKYKITIYVVQFIFKGKPDPDDKIFVFQWMARQYIDHYHPTGAYICEADFEGQGLLRKIYILSRILPYNLWGALYLWLGMEK